MSQPIDTLRLSFKDCEIVLQSLDTAIREPANEKRGNTERIAVGNSVVAVLKLMPTDGRATEFVIRCRNISPGGIGFLHGQFIYPNTPCQTTLINQKKEGYLIHGHVARCRLVENCIHEVGVAFDHEIDLNAVLGISSDEEASETDAAQE